MRLVGSGGIIKWQEKNVSGPLFGEKVIYVAMTVVNGTSQHVANNWKLWSFSLDILARSFNFGVRELLMKQRPFAALPYFPKQQFPFFLKHFYLESLLFLYFCPFEHRVFISTCVELGFKAVSLPPQVGGKNVSYSFVFCGPATTNLRLKGYGMNSTVSHSLYVLRWFEHCVSYSTLMRDMFYHIQCIQMNCLVF